MEMVAAIPDDSTMTIGELSKEWGESTERIMDAIDSVRIFNGGIPYI